MARAHDLEHVVALFERAGVGRLVRRLPKRVVWAGYVLVNGFLSIALLALLAVVTGVPFVFPSLGPTAYLLFFSPLAEAASPRHTLYGHAIGLLCGYGAFAITAGRHGGWPPVIAAALSLGATAALMVLFNCGHPPAGATTMIVSLGLITRPLYLVVIEIAVFLLVAQAFCMNRLAGLPYPKWQALPPGA